MTLTMFYTLAQNEGLIGLIVAIVVVAIPLIWLMGTYNGLVRLRQHVSESWAGIDVELKRRHDLIPNLVQTVKGSAAHERQVFERVVEARNAAVAAEAGGDSPEQLARRENAVTGALRGLFAVAEAYPDLKASANFAQLQRELANTEDRIAASRRFYNANVRDLNTRCREVPSNVVAGLFGFKPAEYFEIEDSSIRLAPQVKL